MNGISVFNFGNDCTIVDDVLYRNGVNKGPLTPEQQQQLKEYQQKVEGWNRAVQQSIQSNFPCNPGTGNFPWNSNVHAASQMPNFGNNWPFGPENNPFGSGCSSDNAPAGARRSGVPPFPSPPPFCKQ
ncbi:unnamed protein product [Toxocara canis]|uniref:Pepsin-I3 domain-containing protein n=1 Tax=Toxocara canis TaxID=6265 RepID=A0A183UU41_TOXCA|nr:unnamed protein product [Toxocara canis]